jgi:hypothetical protein
MDSGVNQHDAEEEVGDQADDFDQRQPELGLSKGFDTQQLEAQERELPSVST